MSHLRSLSGSSPRFGFPSFSSGAASTQSSAPPPKMSPPSALLLNVDTYSRRWLIVQRRDSSLHFSASSPSFLCFIFKKTPLHGLPWTVVGVLSYRGYSEMHVFFQQSLVIVIVVECFIRGKERVIFQWRQRAAIGRAIGRWKSSLFVRG